MTDSIKIRGGALLARALKEKGVELAPQAPRGNCGGVTGT